MGQKDVAAKKRERGHSRLLDLFANGAPSFGESAKEKKTSSAHVGRRCHTREKKTTSCWVRLAGSKPKKMSKRFDAHCWAKPFAIAQILSFFPSSDQPRTVARHIFFCWRGHFFRPRVHTHRTREKSVVLSPYQKTRKKSAKKGLSDQQPPAGRTIGQRLLMETNKKRHQKKPLLSCGLWGLPSGDRKEKKRDVGDGRAGALSGCALSLLGLFFLYIFFFPLRVRVALVLDDGCAGDTSRRTTEGKRGPSWSGQQENTNRQRPVD